LLARAGRLLARWRRPLGGLARHRGERFIRRILLVAALALTAAVLWPEATWSRHRRILDAIMLVESGGRTNPPDGDGGRAIGPYQIHRVYWRDAIKQDPRLGPAYGFDYEHCRRRDYAERVIAAYMRKWVPRAWRAADAEAIARTHNGGPKGARTSATDRYWALVRARLGA
jgi:hypothetical protein